MDGLSRRGEPPRARGGGGHGAPDVGAPEATLGLEALVEHGGLAAALAALQGGVH